MIQRQFTLSESANEYIQEQLATGAYASPDEVVSKAIEEAKIAGTRKKLAEAIREGLPSSAEDIEFTDEWFDQRLANHPIYALDQLASDVEPLANRDIDRAVYGE